jgi:hypothetical protein
MMFAWLRRLFRRKPKAPSGRWRLYGQHEDQQPIFLGEFTGTEDDAWDICRERWINRIWHEGKLQGGQAVYGKFGVVPITEAKA